MIRDDPGRRGLAGLHPVQPAAGGEPPRAGRILAEPEDDVIGQPLGGADRERVAVAQPVQPALAADPQVAVGVLEQREDQHVGARQPLDLNPTLNPALSPGAAERHPREPGPGPEPQVAVAVEPHALDIGRRQALLVEDVDGVVVEVGEPLVGGAPQIAARALRDRVDGGAVERGRAAHQLALLPVHQPVERADPHRAIPGEIQRADVVARETIVGGQRSCQHTGVQSDHAAIARADPQIVAAVECQCADLLVRRRRLPCHRLELAADQVQQPAIAGPRPQRAGAVGRERGERVARNPLGLAMIEVGERGPIEPRQALVARHPQVAIPGLDDRLGHAVGHAVACGEVGLGVLRDAAVAVERMRVRRSSDLDGDGDGKTNDAR